MKALTRHLDIWLFLLLAFVFVTFPQLDLIVSGWFYDPATQTFPLSDQPVLVAIYVFLRYIPFLLVPLFLGLVGWSFYRHNFRKIQCRVCVFLLLSLLIGPGLLVHTVFKEGFDRARPREVQQFGGESGFTPAFVVSDQYHKKSCSSFVSGHAAMGFWIMALAWIVRRRSWFWLGLAMGSVASLGRIMQGGHFLSDTVFAGFVCYFTYRLLSWWLFGYSRIREEQAQSEPPTSLDWFRQHFRGTAKV